MQKFFSDAVEFFPILLQGVWLTIVVTIGSLALSTVLGLFWALLRVSGIGVLVGLTAGLINVIRGIPIIVLLFYLYFVMPDFGIALTALQAYGNIMIMMLKDSSQASTITVAELALQGKLIASSTFQNTSVFTLVALMYLTMSIPLILLVGWLERRYGRR